MLSNVKKREVMNLKSTLIFFSIVCCVACFCFFIFDDGLVEDKPQHELITTVETAINYNIKTERANATKNRENDDEIALTRENESKAEIAHNSMSFEEDWCVANEDLTNTAYRQSIAAIEEWERLQGLYFVDSEYKKNPPNSEYISLYQAIDMPTLIQYAKNDDTLAMSVLLQRSRELPIFEEKTQQLLKEMTEKLLVRGELFRSVTGLINSEIVAAKQRFRKINKIDNIIIDHILSALTYVGYGLENKSILGLEAYLVSFELWKEAKNDSASYDKRSLTPSIFDPNIFLTDDHLATLPIRIEALRDKINEKRAVQFLDPLPLPRDLPAIAQHRLHKDLAYLATTYGEYEVFNARALSVLKNKYYEPTDCSKRLLKRERLLATYRDKYLDKGIHSSE
jgi:hypothetical protein